MALLLVYKTMSGEPIGIFNDEGQAYFQPGFEDVEPDARITVEERGWGTPWSAYVRRLTETTNFQEWWDSIDSTGEMGEVLSGLRDSFFSRRDSKIQHDK